MIGYEREDGTIVASETKCRACLGNRLYRDFQGEWQCLDCNPPQVNYRKKVQEQALRHAIREAQKEVIAELDDEIQHG